MSKRTLAESVEQILLKHISKAGLRPGNTLPSEQKLTEQLGVGRSLVREGLSRLRAMGLITGNKRGGTVLCKPRIFSSLQRLSTYRLFDLEDTRGLMKIRVLLELGAAEFIFKNATNADLRELRALVAADFPSVTAADQAFHRRFFAICGDGMTSEFGELLDTVFEITDIPPVDTPPEQLPTHTDLCNELEHGSFESFHLALRRHFWPYQTLFALPSTSGQAGSEGK